MTTFTAGLIIGVCIGLGTALIIAIGVLLDAKMERDDTYCNTGDNE